MDKKNVSTIKNCFGCGMCAAVCGKHIIQIRLNEKGFYEPTITYINQCTHCGLCIEVCSFANEVLSNKSTPIECYAAWSNEAAVQRKCSSGGVGFEIGRTLINQGYKVCGVCYDTENNRAEDYIAATVEELIPSIGSKYIQSYTQNAFFRINRKEKYLVTGTPCQIDSFRRYLRKFKAEDNFVLMDFFCHSVPSMLAWKKYIALVEREVGKLTYVSWRNKFAGWHDSWVMGMDGTEQHGEHVDWNDSYTRLIKEKKTYLNTRLSQGDIFYRLFLGDYCCNPACQKQCKYKYDASAADIRIGDLWGDSYRQNEDGVSALVCFTPRGVEVVRGLTQSCTLTPHPFEVVAEGQMKMNVGRAYMAPVVERMLRSDKVWGHKAWKLVFVAERVLSLPQSVLRRIKIIINR